MSDVIFCQHLQKEAPALTKAPFPGELGTKILKEISKPGWQAWLGHQTILINEYRLSMVDPKARQFLKEEMVKFLFEGESAKPDSYTPDEAS